MKNKKTNRKTNKKTNNIVKKVLLNCVVALILLLIFFACDAYSKKGEEPYVQREQEKFSSINRICELATLRCYYHNVAEYQKEPEGLFKYGLFQYGYKKLWIEYDGIVDVGVDASQVKQSDPDENGIVKIYVPEAKILNIDADLDSMSEAVADTGVFTSITVADRAEAFSAAQADMKKNAEADNNMLRQAQMNAKELLKQNVISIGERIGKHYTVLWVDKAEDI